MTLRRRIATGPRHPARSRRVHTNVTTAAALAALSLTAASPVLAAPADDDLDQTIDPNQSQGVGQVVRDAGHVDFGPTLNTGEWIIEIHDDTASPSYWRMLHDVVLHVTDAALLTVPDDPAYSFLQLDGGTEAWVIPQNQKTDVIWAGWNTQEPTVLEQLSMGTTLSIIGVEGPGDVTVYLQSGNFGDPEVLWSTHQPFPQQSWISINTHTHANWVFSEPGIYLVDMQFDGQLVDGTEVSARDTMRFAVGGETDPELGFTAEISAPEAATPPVDESGTDVSADEPPASDDTTTVIIFAVVGAVAVALIAAIVIGVVATRSAKKKAAARTAEDSGR